MRYCIVPQCKNTSNSAPDKLFLSVPKGDQRKKWIKYMKRPMSLKSHAFVCEDHLNVEEDVEDWMRYKICKEANLPTFILRLKPDVLPQRFDCQPDRKRAHTPKERSVIAKRKRMSILKEALLGDGPSTERLRTLTSVQKERIQTVQAAADELHASVKMEPIDPLFDPENTMDELVLADQLGFSNLDSVNSGTGDSIEQLYEGDELHLKQTDQDGIEAVDCILGNESTFPSFHNETNILYLANQHGSSSFGLQNDTVEQLDDEVNTPDTLLEDDTNVSDEIESLRKNSKSKDNGLNIVTSDALFKRGILPRPKKVLSKKTCSGLIENARVHGEDQEKSLSNNDVLDLIEEIDVKQIVSEDQSLNNKVSDLNKEIDVRLISKQDKSLSSVVSDLDEDAREEQFQEDQLLNSFSLLVEEIDVRHVGNQVNTHRIYKSMFKSKTVQVGLNLRSTQLKDMCTQTKSKTVSKRKKPDVSSNGSKLLNEIKLRHRKLVKDVM